MKYTIIAYIALGLILSLAIGIEYNCDGLEMLPKYYGSPFVFKQKSIASSMEYYYSISGLLGNILVWGTLLFLIDKAIKTIIGKLNNPKWIGIFYKMTISLMIIFSTLNIAMDSITIGRGFTKGLNYWYWNIDKEAKEWGMTFKGEIITFQK